MHPKSAPLPAVTDDRIYIGLGSNLDDPMLQIQTAVTALQALPHTHVTACSSLWVSKPMGPSDQPDYVNAVVALSSALAPLAVLAACQAIEQAQRRIRTRHWGPRTIDLDVLLFGGEQIHLPTLIVPHPGITERGFVLAPLHQIAPDICIAGKSINHWLEKCDRNGLQALDQPILAL